MTKRIVYIFIQLLIFWQPMHQVELLMITKSLHLGHCNVGKTLPTDTHHNQIHNQHHYQDGCLIQQCWFAEFGHTQLCYLVLCCATLYLRIVVHIMSWLVWCNLELLHPIITLSYLACYRVCAMMCSLVILLCQWDLYQQVLPNRCIVVLFELFLCFWHLVDCPTTYFYVVELFCCL